MAVLFLFSSFETAEKAKFFTSSYLYKGVFRVDIFCSMFIEGQGTTFFGTAHQLTRIRRKVFKFNQTKVL